MVTGSDRRIPAVALLIVALAASSAYALRSNMIKDVTRLEEMGRYEEALFYRRSTMDMVTALHAAWSGAPYDPQMDGLYPQLDRIYGTGAKTNNQMVETRVDRRYWNLVHNQERPITELLKRARLSAAQLQALDDRVRVYVEDHLSPEFDEMGNFFFLRKAEILERTGLFWDASFRRRLVGYYDVRVCAPYYGTTAEELEIGGEPARAAAYRTKSLWYRQQALREFRRSNGDRLLSELQQGAIRQRNTREQVLDILKAGLASKQADARFAAALTLADLGETALLLPAAQDEDAEIRGEAAAASVRAGDVPGLKPGVVAQYFTKPGQDTPVASKVLSKVDIGFRGNERFPDVWRSYWDREVIFPPDASGQFLLKFRGKLRIPREGRYRLYVKTDGANRATARLGGNVVISPRNDPRLLYADQRDWGGATLFRVDFTEPLDLKKGLADLEIDYAGSEVRNKFGQAGIRMYWSSDEHAMEIVPASAFFRNAE